RRAVLQNFRDERTVLIRYFERGCELVIEILDLNSEPSALDAAVVTQLGYHGLRLIRGNCETDADVAAVRREDRRGHPDDVPARVENRATRVAEIDRRIELQIVIVRTRLDVAAASRDDAGRRRTAEPERIADRHDPIAYA